MPANSHSLNCTGIGVAAAITSSGCTPMAMAISSFLPIAAALRRWRAPPRTLSQCTVIEFADCCCSR